VTSDTLPFWVITCSGRRNVMNHIASKGGYHIWSSVCGEFFLTWVILRRERHHDHIWISNCLWRQFRDGAMIGENINMDVTLPFWVIMHSGRRNVMNHIASKGGTIFGRRGVGNGFTMSHTATSSWPYMDFKLFLWRQFRGVAMPLCGKWVCLWPYMGAP